MKLKEYIKQARPMMECSWFKYRFFDGLCYSLPKSMYYNSIDFSVLGDYEIVGEPKFYGTMHPLLFILYGRVKSNDYSRMVQ